MNVLLENWETPFGLPPFAKIRDEDFAPAFEIAIERARAAVLAIAEGEATDFVGVIDALELSQEDLDRVSGVFFNLLSADSNEMRESLALELAPKLSALSSEITNNKALWAKIDALWQARADLSLTPEQLRVLELRWRSYMRAGAALDGEAAERLTAVMARLAVLETQFCQNVLDAERAWMLPLADEHLVGLPDFLVEAARTAGADRNMGPVLTLSRSLLIPFMKFSPLRDLRRQAHAGWMSLGANGDALDNRAIGAEILALRAERAALLGYRDFASFMLEADIAKTPEAVRALLRRVWEPARAKALADEKVLQAMLEADGITGPLQAWDWRYYSEKRRLSELNLNEAALMSYRSLEALLAGIFDCANRLFGLEFREMPGPFYHPDVRGWDVTRNGAHVAVLLGDYYARPSKTDGAWCSGIRAQRKLGGEVRPIVMNVCTYFKSDPCLLSTSDARSLFHEFGHALHLMLSNVTYASVEGFNVERDFAEMPSQLYEHWLDVPEVLETHARHYQTGAPMPRDLAQRLIAARTYDQGFLTVEYLASCFVDLECHVGPPPEDMMQKEAEVLASLGMPHAIREWPSLSHSTYTFGGDGYACGYFTYLWSELMDADAFAAFQETGDPFDQATAAKLEKFILSAGGSEPAEALYVKFRGRMPGVEPLLRNRGLLDAA